MLHAITRNGGCLAAYSRGAVAEKEVGGDARIILTEPRGDAPAPPERIYTNVVQTRKSICRSVKIEKVGSNKMLLVSLTSRIMLEMCECVDV